MWTENLQVATFGGTSEMALSAMSCLWVYPEAGI